MQSLMNAVLALAALVPPAKVRSIADALRGHATRDEISAIASLVGTPLARSCVERLIESWAAVPTTGDELAGMLIGAAESRRRLERELDIELVWTGPTTRYAPTRRTEQVLLDLIAGAKVELFVVSFVAHDLPSVTTALNEAAARGVRIRVLLEASKQRGGSLDIDPATTMATTVPAAEIFSWKRRTEPFSGGKVHAKVAVVDACRAFITSANLTAWALDRNMEAGVLVNGGALPKLLNDHLQALIDTGHIELMTD